MAEQLFKQVARMDGTDDFDLVPYTAAEIADFEASRVAGLARQAAEVQTEQDVVNARSSGIDHALSLGFTQAQAEAMFP